MSTARFHVTGENMLWLQARIQEEIQAQGLEGTAVTAGKNTIAVIVEGDKGKISDLYDNLVRLNPSGLKFSKITSGEYDATEKTTRDLMLTSSMDVMLRLLEKIEENTRDMNRKLDGVLGKKTETAISSESSNAFTSIFGSD
ncbi:MAG: hypothetical protein NTU61_05040 [Candidatus Altiarchaeota archaeon]|nr:hypothetical protein [Candidatus Altiarchaeota archaeon]